MSINPNDINTVKVGDLPSSPINLTDNIAHEVGSDLNKATVQDLADVVSTYIGTLGGLAFNPTTVSDGQTLPTTTINEWILVGKGTFINVGGGSNITTTEELNALASNGTTWSIAVEIPISVELAGITQNIRSGYTETVPSEDVVFNALAEKLNISDFPEDRFLNAVGSFNYSDLATQTTPLNASANVPLKLTNDKLGANTDISNAPYGISSIWNSTTNQLDFTQLAVGDMLNIRLDTILNTGNFDHLYSFYIRLGIGSPSEKTYNFTQGQVKTPSDFRVTETIPITIFSTDIRNNPAEIYYLSDIATDVTVNGWYVDCIRKNINIVSIVDNLGYTPENVLNKQNNLFTDGTGQKYPTVDAVNAEVVKLIGEQTLSGGEKTFADNVNFDTIVVTNAAIGREAVGSNEFVVKSQLDSVSSALDLQSVTDNGNTTTTPITVTDSLGIFAIKGISTNGVGVRGESVNGIGVRGDSVNNAGLYGTSTDDVGVRGESVNDIGVYGISENNIGVFGVSENDIGVYGFSENDIGVFGVSTNDISFQTYGNGTIAAELNLGNSNKGLVVNSGASSTGDVISHDKNGVVNFKVNQQGETTGGKFIKTGGLSTEFLKADGSVDSNVVKTTETQTITGEKTFSLGGTTALFSEASVFFENVATAYTTFLELWSGIFRVYLKNNTTNKATTFIFDNPISDSTIKIPSPTSNGNYTLATTADVALKQAALTTQQVTLIAANWSANQQVLTVTGATATNLIFVSPEKTRANYISYGDAEISVISQGTNTLTFECTTVPTTNINVNIAI